MEESDFRRTSNSYQNVRNQEPKSSDISIEIGMLDIDMMARHVAAHLQNLTFLSTSLFSIRNYGEDDVDSVTTQSPSEEWDTGSQNSTRKLQSNKDSVGDRTFPEQDVAIDRLSDLEDRYEPHEAHDMVEAEENVDWSDVIQSTKKKEQWPKVFLHGLTHYDEFDLFLIKYRFPVVPLALQKHLARAVQIRRQEIQRRRKEHKVHQRAPLRFRVAEDGEDEKDRFELASFDDRQSALVHDISIERFDDTIAGPKSVITSKFPEAPHISNERPYCHIRNQIAVFHS
jgi:hypothetical protein